jgi:hypothetical protein
MKTRFKRWLIGNDDMISIQVQKFSKNKLKANHYKVTLISTYIFFHLLSTYVVYEAVPSIAAV